MKKINVVAAIIRKSNQILIAKRSKGELSDLWEFPGGKIEYNESPQQALKREIYEELEIEIEVKEHLMTIEHDYSNFHLFMDCFFCIYVDGNIKLSDHSEYKWVTADNKLKSINWVPADAKIIDLIIKKMN